MELLKIDQKSCKKDGICAATCPVGIISFQKEEVPRLVDGADEICINCGHCVSVCPTSSISHRRMAVGDCLPIEKDLSITAQQAEQLLQSRRSIRAYKSAPVTQDEIERLIQVAKHAPSGHNTQGVEWLVLGNQDQLQKLGGVVIDWMHWMLQNMAELALSLHMDRAVERWEGGDDTILRGAPNVIVAHADKQNRMASTTATIALTYLEIAAAARGLGCCWAGYFNTAASTFPPMKKALSLPENHNCLGSMMLGYPRYKYHRIPLRNEPKITWRL